MVLKVIIIGGGPNGLSAAYVLKKMCNIQTELYEAEAQLVQTGAGVHLGSNGSRVLIKAGLGDLQQKAQGCIPTEWQCCDMHGKVLTSVPVDAIQTKEAPYLLMNRKDYNAALANACEEIGVPIHLGMRATKVDTDTATVTFENGTTATADFIVGGDGLKSVCRDAVDTSTDSGVEKSGNSSDNALVPTSIMEADEGLKTLIGKITIWVGPKAHVILTPVRGGTMHAFATSRPDEGSREAWHPVDDIFKVAKFLDGWDPRLIKLVSHMQNGVRIGMVYRNPLSTWHKGRVVLIGDAAHAMLPFTGQGLSMGLEDVDLLAALLKDVKNDENLSANLERAFTILYKARNPRTSFILSMAIKNKPLMETDVPEEMEKRDKQFAEPEGPQHVIFFKNPPARSAVFGYKTEDVLAKLQQQQQQAA